MTKRLIILFLALGLMTHQLTGCSSSDSKDEGSAAASNDDSFSDESNGDFASDDSAKEGEKSAEAEKAPEDEGKDLATTDDAAKSGAKDELSLDDEGLPEDVAANTADPAAAPPAATENVAPTAEPPVEAKQDVPSPPPTDESVFKDQAPPVAVAEAPAPETPAPVAETAVVAAPKTFAPLQKIKTEPYSKNGANVNRVYLVRQGDDTLKAVSQKIYGKNRTKDLKAWNPGVHNSVKVGDKVYYESAKDPADTHMLTYYEDIGQAPSVYVSKDGDNVRKVSKDLLGNSNSWKEVWATNPSVESKGDIPAGLQIKYWGDTPAGGGETVAAAKAPEKSVGDLEAPPPEMPAPPPAPPTAAAMNDPMQQPPPPPPDMNNPAGGAAAAGTVANNNMAPPPPPPQEMAPPPPPPEPKPIAKKAPAAAADSGSDPDTMMAIGFGGILLIAAAALFVVIRKNRAKRVDLSQTQV